MCFGMSLAILDIQIVASSFTAIQAYFHVRTDQLSWIQTAYLIAEVIAIPLTGWLTRAFSLRGMYVGAMLGFTLASVGCALATTLPILIAVRIFQGLCGGMLVPAVFTSVFTMMPEQHRVTATAIAGTAAVLAPAVGPAIGGYITQYYGWHWIFLINVVPGILVATTVYAFIRIGKADFSQLRRIDYGAIALTALSLAALELLLNQGPQYGWDDPLILSCLVICITAGAAAVRRNLFSKYVFVDLHLFRERTFAIGCGLSFTLGMGLYSSVFLLALFLGLVRQNTPLEIGEIMLVTGVAQTIAAPAAAWMESVVDPRWLTAVGYTVFAAGLITNGLEAPASSLSTLWLPQILRGVSIMLCILPATRLALDTLKPALVADGSALFNLMRNLGGAIGIALADTILQEGTKANADTLVRRLQAGDSDAARLVGLPVEYFHGQQMGPVTDTIRTMVTALVHKAALVQSFNEAWIAVGSLFVLSLLAVPFMRHIPKSPMDPGTDPPINAGRQR